MKISPQLTKNHQKRLFNQLLFERKYYNLGNYGSGRLFSTLKRKIPFGIHAYSFLEADYTKAPIQ